MIVWFIKWFIFSFILIIILHYLYNFYIDKLTIPKEKDYIYNQEQTTDILNNNNDTKNNDNDNKNNDNKNNDNKSEQIKLLTQSLLIN
jgi:hypothetical protein